MLYIAVYIILWTVGYVSRKRYVTCCMTHHTFKWHIWPFSMGTEKLFGNDFLLYFIFGTIFVPAFVDRCSRIMRYNEKKSAIWTSPKLELTDLTGPKYCACREKWHLPQKGTTRYRPIPACSVPTIRPAMKSTAGTASASSIVWALDLKRERLLFQNLKATPAMKKSASPPAIQNLIRWGASALNIIYCFCCTASASNIVSLMLHRFCFQHLSQNMLWSWSDNFKHLKARFLTEGVGGEFWDLRQRLHPLDKKTQKVHSF